MTFIAAFILAHQSDWFSVTLVAIPVLGFVALLAVARHRVRRDGPVAVGEEAIPPSPNNKTSQWH